MWENWAWNHQYLAQITRDPDKHFMGGMCCAILNNALSTTFGSLIAILVPYVGHPIYEVT